MRLYFGVRSERDVYHEPLLRDLAARHANFTYDVVLSEQIGAAVGVLREAGMQTRADGKAEDGSEIARRVRMLQRLRMMFSIRN